jgi:hypothetical protein
VVRKGEGGVEKGMGKRDEKVEEVRRTLETVRRGDVLLLRNVALSVFQGKIHGQSLRRGGTSLRVLERDGDGVSEGGEGWRERRREVERWLEAFVGMGGGGGGGKARVKREALPPDTQ